jgi:hypothetical protein
VRGRDLTNEMIEHRVGGCPGSRVTVRRRRSCLCERSHAGARQQRKSCDDAANEHATTDD